MPKVVATHDVKDVDHWLSSPKRAVYSWPLGVTDVRTFVDPRTGPTSAGVWTCRK